MKRRKKKIVKGLSAADRELLESIALKYQDIVFFPEKVKAAEEYLRKMKNFDLLFS